MFFTIFHSFLYVFVFFLRLLHRSFFFTREGFTSALVALLLFSCFLDTYPKRESVFFCFVSNVAFCSLTCLRHEYFAVVCN